MAAGNFLLSVLLKNILRVIGFFKGEQYKYSQDYEDNFKYMDAGEKIWWAYKAMVRQIERAQKGKQIEEFFANQDFEIKKEPGFEPGKTITITAGGDLSTSGVITPQTTEQLWDDVRDFYFSADIICANLETPIDTSRAPVNLPEVCLTAPGLNNNVEMFKRFIDNGCGINLFSTANNHCLDQGEEGLAATLDFLDEQGYAHTGTSRTPNEQQNFPVLEKKGIRTAFLAYTYSLNSFDPIPGKEYLTNVIRLNKPDTDLSLLKEHVETARRKNAGLVVAMLHWSIEFETYPLVNIIKMGHRVIECGVDVIIGSHAHVAQPMESYTYRNTQTGEMKRGFIIYSLGELVSYNAFSRNSRLAWLLKITAGQQTDGGLTQIKIIDIKALPVYTLIRKRAGRGFEYRLLDFKKTMNQVHNGLNPYGFNKQETRELLRLETLLYQRLLPHNSKSLLGE